MSLIVVSYNSSDHIETTVRQLESTLAGYDGELLVVDNASTDDTAAVAARVVHRGSVIALANNVGYGRGANEGLRRAKGRISVILNDDVSIEPGSLDLLMRSLEEENAALAAPRMVAPDGTSLPSARQDLPGLWDEMARVRDRLTGNRARLVRETSGPPIQVDFVVAACLVGRTKYLREIGGFSDAFFMYGEDIDLCRRVKQRGGKVIYLPEATASHDQALADGRRIRGHRFSERILDARDTYYRIWLDRPERMMVNLIRAFGVTDQPYRMRYHGRRLFGGNSLKAMRAPSPIEFLDD